MTVIAPDTEVAIGNDTTIGDFGRLTLRNSKDLPVLDIVGSVTTKGGPGTSLVRGQQVQQGITAAGLGSDAVRLTGEVAGLDEVTVTAAQGRRIVSELKEER